MMRRIWKPSLDRARGSSMMTRKWRHSGAWPPLNVKNVPDPLYRKLQARAAASLARWARR
jgi:hypothetical protein